MDPVFAKSILPRTFTCLGRTLQPLSVGHYALLDILDSPFIVGGPTTTGDLVTAVYLCSLPYAQARQRFDDEKTLVAECQAWGRQIGRRVHYARAARRFDHYLQHYLRGPELFAGDAKHKASAPLVWLLLYVLQVTYHLSADAAWNMPVNEALCRAATAQDVNGLADIVTEYDKALGKQAEDLQRRIDALLKKEGKAP